MSQIVLRQIPKSGVVSNPLVYFLNNQQEIKIGRETDCHIPLDSRLYGGVSRYHVSLRPLAQAGTWEICDRGSSNGTFINGQRLNGCQRLNNGDRIVLGNDICQFIFEVQSPNPVAVVANGGTSSSDGISMTQLFPVFSNGSELMRKGFLIPGILTVIFVIAMFVSIGHFGRFALTLALYLSGGAFYFIYQLGGKWKPWWLMIVSAISTIILLVSPVWGVIVVIFRQVLPGDVFNLPESATFSQYLVAHFFGAGLAEELLKSIPIFALLIIGLLFGPSWRSKIGVVEPLDGILIGAASAVGFTLFETLAQYVPQAIQSGSETTGLQLLIPRILGSIAGHMAYSGYFGYFIGLSVLKPKYFGIIIPIGYLSSSILHAFWNAVASIPGGIIFYNPIVGIISYVFLVAAIIKARKLSPNRAQNFATYLKP